MEKSKAKTIFDRIFRSFVWLGVILLVIDIVTKNAVVRYFAHTGNDAIVLIPGFLRINYVINTNAAFGLGSNNPELNRILYCVIAGCVSIGLLVYFILRYRKLNLYYRACLVLVLSGAIGNLIDRIFYSPEYLGNSLNGVVDWIDFYGIWPFNFNIADSCIVVAAFMIIIYMIVTEIIDYRKKKKEKPVAEKTKGPVYSKQELERMEAEKKESEETEKAD